MASFCASPFIVGTRRQGRQAGYLAGVLNTSAFSAPRAVGKADRLANLSAASYAAGALAAESVVAACGSNLATATESARSVTLPVTQPIDLGPRRTRST